jgi:small subunit ribosomal protein S21
LSWPKQAADTIALFRQPVTLLPIYLYTGYDAAGLADARAWRSGGLSAPPSSPDFKRTEEGRTLQVIVRENNVDQALRVLKKKMQREGIFREMKARRAYEKPSERRGRQKAEAIRRARKAARKLAIREGLIAGPKKKPLTPRRPVVARPAS